MHGKAARRLSSSKRVPRQSALMNALVTILAEGGVSAGDAQKLREQSERGNDLGGAAQRPCSSSSRHSTSARPAGAAWNLLQVLAYVGAGHQRPRRPAAARRPQPPLMSERPPADMRPCLSLARGSERANATRSVRWRRACHAAAPLRSRWLRDLLWMQPSSPPRNIRAPDSTCPFCRPHQACLGIAQRHAALQGEVCSLLHACLMHEPPADSTPMPSPRSLSSSAARRAAPAPRAGLLAPGPGRLEAWLAKADLSLVRHLMMPPHWLPRRTPRLCSPCAQDDSARAHARGASHQCGQPAPSDNSRRRLCVNSGGRGTEVLVALKAGVS